MRPPERGSASILAMVMAGLVVVGAVGLAWAVGAVAVRHQAHAGADLAALAGAQAHVIGGPACPVAAEVARSNGARLVGCRTLGTAVWAQVETVRSITLLGREIPVLARRAAWAGPHAWPGSSAPAAWTAG